MIKLTRIFYEYHCKNVLTNSKYDYYWFFRFWVCPFFVDRGLTLFFYIVVENKTKRQSCIGSFLIVITSRNYKTISKLWNDNFTKKRTTFGKNGMCSQICEKINNFLSELILVAYNLSNKKRSDHPFQIKHAVQTMTAIANQITNP